jgi:hypothetical protein
LPCLPRATSETAKTSEQGDECYDMLANSSFQGTLHVIKIP